MAAVLVRIEAHRRHSTATFHEGGYCSVLLGGFIG